MMPAIARDILGTGPAGLGALLGVPAFGALVGSGVVIAMGNPKHKGKLIIEGHLALHDRPYQLRLIPLFGSISCDCFLLRGS